jgi:hypothetical protein
MNGTEHVLDQIDPLNFTTVRIGPFFNDLKLGDATGFFFYGLLEGKPNLWLVTNWHVLSGRNALDPTIVLHRQGSVPNRLRLSLILRPGQPEYNQPLYDPPPQLLNQQQTSELYENNGSASWYQHPIKNVCDVGVLNARPFVERFLIHGINQIAEQNDMAIQQGNAVFILGYPLGFSHFIDTPIWKSGCIASEPHLETVEETAIGGGRVIIDATTRQGMSGAPVIMREKTHYLAENGEIIQHANATRWIGIYASRPNILIGAALSDEDRRPEIGYFYKSGAVQKTITDGIRGPNFGELP